MQLHRMTTVTGLVLAVVTATLADVPVVVPPGQPGCGCQPPTYYTCQQVVEKVPIKKIVYECRMVPYCEHMLHKFGHCPCDSCQSMCCEACQACPKFKKVLFKKEIVIGEKCVVKCVPIPVPCPTCGCEATLAPPVPPATQPDMPPVPPTAEATPVRPKLIGLRG